MKSYMKVIKKVDVKYISVEFTMDEEDLKEFEEFQIEENY